MMYCMCFSDSYTYVFISVALLQFDVLLCLFRVLNFLYLK